MYVCLRCLTLVYCALPAVVNPDERMCLVTDDSGCRYRFVYGYDKSNNPLIRAQPTKQCPAPINVLGR